MLCNTTTLHMIMTLTDGQSLQTIAPLRTDEPSKATHTVPRRTKRSTACSACKGRKSRCTGTQPCDKCIETGSNCLFAEALDRRRKYAQKRAEQNLDATQQLLDRIVEAFSEGNITQLSWLLSIVKKRGTDEQLKDGITGVVRKSNVQTGSFPRYRSRRAHSVDSSSSSVSVGSLNEVDTLTEDPNRNEETRATGYIGKGSEIAWMQKLDTETRDLNRDWHQPVSPLEDTVTPMSYHLDNLQIAEPLSIAGDARALPPKSWAAQLLNIYLESVGPTFPVVDQQLFVSQFNSAFIDNTQQPTQKWLAVLNLVLAIAAKYYQVAEPVSGRDVDDHVFLSRAIALTTTRWLAIQHADLHQVQIDLLLAIYYLASGQVNRSWQITGRAARSAIALGLNLRETSGQIDPVSKETRTRLWWSIFHLEHLLSGMTGRSTCVDYRALSVYPPAPYDEREFQTPEVAELLSNTALREERLQWTIYASDSTLQSRNQWFSTLSPSQSLYFFHLVDLSIITHAAVTSIYSLTTGKDTGQSGISYYQERLQTWLTNLQLPFAFTDPDNQLNISRQSREQVSLALSYYSSQIILSRPCLTCPDFMEGYDIRVPRSRFGNATAKTCVDAAMTLTSVFPDTPDMEWLLKMTPWCSVLHYMMQALTILLIQLSVGPVQVMATHGAQSGQGEDTTAENPDAVLGAAKKIIRWLHCLAEQDASARRAFKICNSFIRRIASAKEFNLHGIPSITSLPEHNSGFQSTQSKRRGSKEGSGSGIVPGGSQNNMANWGPDRTVNEANLDGPRQNPYSLDPALFSWVDKIEEEDCSGR
ncbi:hypothetical protein N7451_005507 [Penicillium sp. IBT 35674x]|nr:hypothetical protein N7451_005507 [Penicillium sp. IBT 35674x]